jgi:agmatinase
MAADRLVDGGDADVLPTDVESTFRNITDTTRRVIGRGRFRWSSAATTGITFPVVRAFDEGIDLPMHIVHFDAHLDYMPFVHGLSLTNQHAFRHIRRMAHVETLTQIGIRSLRGSQAMLEDSLRDFRARRTCPGPGYETSTSESGSYGCSTTIHAMGPTVVLTALFK